MKTILRTSFLVTLLHVITSSAQVAPLQITLYYESLCPDSRYFVAKPLHSALQSFPELNVKYVPFGKANSNGYGGFDCQHGPRECRGNIVHACALARLAPGTAQHDFVYCAMLYPDQYERCAVQSGLSWVDIDSCSQSPEGPEYHRNYEVLTKQNTDGPSFVPSLAFNDVFEKSQSKSAFDDFESYLCTTYYPQHPKCNQSAGLFFGRK